jgi:hypothetical protein
MVERLQTRPVERLQPCPVERQQPCPVERQQPCPVMVIDLDGTYVRGNTLHIYLRCALRHHLHRLHLGRVCGISALLVLRLLHLISHPAMKFRALRLAGCDAVLLRDFAERVLPLINPKVEQLRLDYEARGGLTLLATAAADFYVPAVWHHDFVATVTGMGEGCNRVDEGRMCEEVNEGRMREKVDEGRMCEEVDEGRIREEVDEGRIREEVDEGRIREEVDEGRIREEVDEGRIREEVDEGRMCEEGKKNGDSSSHHHPVECRGEEKLRRTMEWINARGGRLDVVITDHTDDLPLLRANTSGTNYLVRGMEITIVQAQ